MTEFALTIRQPWADLVMAGVKDVENRTWPVPQTVAPAWATCLHCGARRRKAEWWDDAACWTNYAGRTYSHSVEDDTDPFPFRLWIHAASQVDPLHGSAAWVWDEWYASGRRERDLLDRKGVLLGSVTVTGCHHASECERADGDHISGIGWSDHPHCSRWAERDVWHWTLTNPVPLDVPVTARGWQRLWRLDDQLVRDVGAQLASAEGVTA